MAVNEWCCSENQDYGVALMLLDNQLIEFDHIHTDKTDKQCAAFVFNYEHKKSRMRKRSGFYFFTLHSSLNSHSGFLGSKK